MIDRDQMKQILKGVPEEDLRSSGELLAVKLGPSELVESAALIDPASGACNGLCLSYTMGVDGVEGMEEDTVEICHEEGGVPLAELALLQDGSVRASDPGDISLVFWNCLGRAVTVEGGKVEPGGCLLLKVLSGEELDRAIQAYLKAGGDVRC